MEQILIPNSSLNLHSNDMNEQFEKCILKKRLLQKKKKKEKKSYKHTNKVLGV